MRRIHVFFLSLALFLGSACAYAAEYKIQLQLVKPKITEQEAADYSRYVFTNLSPDSISALTTDQGNPYSAALTSDSNGNSVLTITFYVKG